MNIVNPVVFISYSWDNETHKEWVLGLAGRMRGNGIDVILDRYHLKPGSNLPFFVENSIKRADRIVIVLTPNYKLKAEMRQGGVGQEYSMINNELLKNITSNSKIIPILKVGDKDTSIPNFLEQYIFTNFTSDNLFEESYEDLIREIYKEPKIEIPALGEKPIWKSLKEVAKDEIIKSILELSKNFNTKPLKVRRKIAGDIYELAPKITITEALKIINENDFNTKIASAICIKSIVENSNTNISKDERVLNFIYNNIGHDLSMVRYRIMGLVVTSDELKNEFKTIVTGLIDNEQNNAVKRLMELTLNINSIEETDDEN